MIAALIVSLLFGAGGWMEGCATIAYYKGERINDSVMLEGIANDADRASLQALGQREIEVRDHARSRAFPVGVATFVLGAAMLALAARAMSGRKGARLALVQVVVVQAALVVGSFWLTADVRAADFDHTLGMQIAQLRQKVPDKEQFLEAEQLQRTMWHYLTRFGAPLWLAGRTLAAALIVVALTRPRTREFFEAAAGPVSER